MNCKIKNGDFFIPIDDQLLRKVAIMGIDTGFDAVGIISMRDISINNPNLDRLNEWIKLNQNGSMNFMERNKEMLVDPKLIMGDARSVVCCCVNYSYLGENEKINNVAPRYRCSSPVAKYALGQDYHTVVKKMLKHFAEKIEIFLHELQIDNQHNDNKNLFNLFKYRTFCDSVPILEKHIACQAGLGFIGKNTLLINKKLGSYMFLGELFTNIEIENKYTIFSESKSESELNGKVKHSDRCGSCKKCIEACPTKALYAPFSIDARKCIAYLTVEHKGNIDENIRSKIGVRIFGCDACQRCCPHNRKINSIGTRKIFVANPQISKPRELYEFLMWSEEDYEKNTESSPMRRISYEKWLNNVLIAIGNDFKNKTKNILVLMLNEKKLRILSNENFSFTMRRLKK